MESTSRSGHGYHDVRVGGSGRAHLGDVHYNYGPSPDERILNDILDSLSYPGMNDRRDVLAEAHEGTFDWAFLDGDTDFVTKRFLLTEEAYTSSIRMNFKTWLQDDSQGLFYFTGKPGSGKSVFMKSLALNNKVERLLKDWTAECILLRADHWFWVTGLPMQKSMEGMLRNLLRSVLRSLAKAISENIEAIKHICGDRWISENTHGAWSCDELKSMLSRLSSLDGIRTFLLIDGLDECEPQDRLSALADEIVRISHLANIKICVSCRPWKVFANSFAECETLRLDQLTYRDMETYVRSQLLVAEAFCDLQTEIRDENLAAKRFIWRVVNAAEGVFLWTKLATNELCSELRKGRSIKMLDKILTRIPSDLDDYFHKLIFERIGRSQQNAMDTAAALRLAMEIHLSEGKKSLKGLRSAFPFARNLINFWLLSSRHLDAGFSWEDYRHISQPSSERMIKQTARFLEEACNELLVISPQSKNVDFFHRTVYDYLTNDNSLVQNSPNHFGDADFLTELARLRCICLLREGYADCGWLVNTLSSMFCQDDLVYTAPWVIACEELVSSQIRDICTCYGLSHLSSREDPTVQLMTAGFDDFICDELALMPHLAICENGRRDYAVMNLVGSALQATDVVAIQSSRCISLRKILDCGSNPNALRDDWQIWASLGFRSHLSGASHRRTHWEAWLAELYLQSKSKSYIGVANHNHGKSSPARLLTSQQKIGDMVELLLRHGADPCCTFCISGHDYGGQCKKISFQEVLEALVPTDRIPKLQALRKSCARRRWIYTLRRNQRRRAARSLITSEESLSVNISLRRETMSTPEEAMRQLHTQSIEGMIGLNSSNAICCICKETPRDAPGARPSLAVWCIECGSLSCLCLPCSEQHPTVLPTHKEPCETFDSAGHTYTQDHESMIVMCSEFNFSSLSHKVSSEYSDSVKARYPISQAIHVVKEWYAKNPIEPDLPFEEVLAETSEEVTTPQEGSDSRRSGRRFLARLLHQSS